MHRIARAVVLTVVLLGASSAPAAQISFSDSIPLTTTNWSSSVTLGLFNTNFGTLTGITFTIKGHVEGNISVESTDNAATTVTSALQAEIKLTRPDTTTITAVIPSIGFSDNLAAFDGSIDFGGASGEAHLGASADASESFSSPPPASDLTLFSSAGGGTISLDVSATGLSEATGAGNLVTLFQTAASAEVTVVYDFIPNTAVPEPATFVSAALGLGGLGLAGLRRRTKSA